MKVARPALEQRRRGVASLDQGEFGEAWIRTIAAAAGLDCASTPVQRGGTDLTMTYPQKFGFLTEFEIKAQVKTVAAPTYDSAGNIVYDLDADTHRRLAGPSQTPMFLFLVVVSSEQWRWVLNRDLHDELSHGAFWLSLARDRPTANRSTQRVRVPSANRLSPAALRRLCVHAALQYLIAADTAATGMRR